MERSRTSQAPAAANLVFGGEVKSVEDWIAELEGQWITPRRSDEMIEDERTLGRMKDGYTA